MVTGDLAIWFNIKCDPWNLSIGSKGENMKPYEGKHETQKWWKHETLRGKT